MVQINAKRAIRIAILIAGLVGTFIAANVQTVPVADGGPIITCGQGGAKCGLPPVS